MSVNQIQVAIHWLVDHQWFCVVAFNFSKSIFEEVLKEEEEKRRKKKNKRKRKKEKKGKHKK